MQYCRMLNMKYFDMQYCRMLYMKYFDAQYCRMLYMKYFDIQYCTMLDMKYFDMQYCRMLYMKYFDIQYCRMLYMKYSLLIKHTPDCTVVQVTQSSLSSAWAERVAHSSVSSRHGRSCMEGHTMLPSTLWSLMWVWPLPI